MERNGHSYERNIFQARSDMKEIFPSFYKNWTIQILSLGNVIECIMEFQPVGGVTNHTFWYVADYPACRDGP